MAADCSGIPNITSKEAVETQPLFSNSEDFLTDKLFGEEKKRFLRYLDARTFVDGESTPDCFITDFRGAQFAIDTFVTSKAPYTDYLKDEP